MPVSRRFLRLRDVAALCVLAVAAWALARSPAGPAPGISAVPANAAPTLVSDAPDGVVRVRAGERATLRFEALDPDVAADGSPEAVWLSAAVLGGDPPGWLGRSDWSAGPSENPGLAVEIAPPADAAPASFTLVAGATDSRGRTVVGGRRVSVAAKPAVVASLDGPGPPELAEDAGEVWVRLTLENPPAAGAYTGCGLRPGSGGEAGSPADVVFQKSKPLEKDNGWTVRARLLAVVDDDLVEGDESLVVEGYCARGRGGAEPPPAELVSRPLTLTILDNDDPPPLALSARPERIGETLGAQAVTVAATLEEAAASATSVALAPGAGAYTVSGTQVILVAAGATGGSTVLEFTPTDDGNAVDDAVSIGGTAPGFAVAAAALTITEPVVAGGVDVSGLRVELAVRPSAIREGTSGTHRVSARLAGAPVPAVDVALSLAVGGTATDGTSHDYTLTGTRGWEKLTVSANDAHRSADTAVTVAALSDSVEEGEETIVFSVSGVVWGETPVALAAPAAATLRITELWETPPAPDGLAAAPDAGDARHGLDVAWNSVAAVPPVDGYVVRHRPVSSPPASWSQTGLRPGTATALVGLAAGTRHELRVFARNAAGDGPESGSAYARTDASGCGVAAPRVTTPGGARSSTELEIAWPAPVCATAVASYRVSWREDPDTEDVENAWLEAPAASAAATLVGLAPDTGYVVRVLSVLANGDRGDWSTPGRGRTGLDTRRPPRVAAPMVAASAVDGGSNLDATWRRVSWTDGKGAAQPVSEYQYRLRAEGDDDWSRATDARATGAETSTMTRTLSGLASGTAHEVRVRAVNRVEGVAHPGKWSRSGRGRTWGVPGRVMDVSAYMTGRAVEVLWEAPDDGGAAITDYDVEHRRSGAGWKPHAYAGCGGGGCATEASIAATAKRVRVRAANAVGVGEWSATARVRDLKLLRVSFGAAEASVDEGRSLLVTVRLDLRADRAVAVPLTTAGGAGSFRLDGTLDNAVTIGAGTDAQAFTLVALPDGDGDDALVTLGFGVLPDGVVREAPASLAVVVVDDDANNTAPSFGMVSVVREIAENAGSGAAVGAPVAATDAENDPLAYSLAGSDAGRFSVDASTGQIRVGAGAAPDHEAASSHALTVQVADGLDAAGDPDPAVDASVAVAVSVLDAAEPPAPPDAPALAASGTEIAVEWTPPGNTGPPISGYGLRHREVGGPGWTDAGHSGTGTSATIANLPPGAAHEVAVLARNDEGDSAWSAPSFANTPPRVALAAEPATAVIGAGNEGGLAILTATVEAPGGGALEGAWLERNDGRSVEVAGFAMDGGGSHSLGFGSPVPGVRAHGFRVRQELAGRATSTDIFVRVRRVPTVTLSVSPDVVAEGAGETEFTVTARLSGREVESVAKRIRIEVAGGTATAGEDYAAVPAFDLDIPPGRRSATGTFRLGPAADGAEEGPETVAVSGRARQGAVALPVVGTAVEIADGAVRRTLEVAAPSNGRIAGGGIDCGGAGTDCAATHADGAAVVLAATADDGYRFSNWTGDCSGAGDCALTMDADKSVGAAFAAVPTYTLTVSAPSNGRVAGTLDGAAVIDCGADCSETAPGGSVVALTAEAAEGYGFSSWTGACASAGGANCSVTLNADRSVGATFAVGAVDGKCDITSVDACRAGGLNTADARDSDTDHRWRCDGRHGGADSAVCEFPKRGCGAGERNWNLGANACAADVGAAGSGAVATAEDGDGAVTGRAAFKCDDAVWTERAGATCGRECAPVPGQTWSDGEDACAGPLAKTPHLGGATATDTTYPATGTATFACNDSVWSAPTADSCRAGCAARTTAGCDLSDTVDGGSSGVCASDHTGACAYSCGDGAWTVAQNTCEPKGPEKVDGKCDNTSADACLAGDANTTDARDSDTDHRWRCDGRHGGANSEACEFPKKACATGDLDWRVGANTCTGAVAGLESGGSRTASDDKGGTTGEAAFKCDDAVWTERPGATCGRECAAANRTWREGSDTCSGRLAKTGHLKDATATDTTYSATGTAAYRCGDAVWSGPVDASCKGGCAATTLSNCVLPNTVHDGDAGRCAATHEGSCRYSCGDGNWTRSSNACEPKPVDGVCGTAARDTCAKGVPNTAAFTDSDDYHYWRCDGRHRGANSGKCRFEKKPCNAYTLGWTVGAHDCVGNVSSAPSGQVQDATDSGDSPNGMAKFKCDDGSWKERDGASCAPCDAVNGGWQTTYGDWSACSTSACEQSGEHSRTFTRTCDDPVASCGGTECSGGNSGTETGSCSGTNPRNGGWTSESYSAWSACSATACGTSGTRTRTWTRACTNPTPGCMGNDCAGDAAGTEEVGCSAPACRYFDLTISPVPTNGRVAGSGISCPEACTVSLQEPNTATLSANPNVGYELKEWSGACGTETEAEAENQCKIEMNSDKTASAMFQSNLRVDAGGTYDAVYTFVPAPLGSITIFTAMVEATITGGAPPLTIRWSNQTTTAKTTFVYVTPKDYSEEVAVTDKDDNRVTDTAVIRARVSRSQSDGAAGGAPDDGGLAPFEVPFGGEFYFIWGEVSAVRAQSGDGGVVGVSVDSRSIRVTGLGVGSTDVILATGHGELRLPVVVR